MKKCTKCGHQINAPIHYCPFCGTLLPSEKEMALIDKEEFSLAIEADNCVEYDTKEWKAVLDFYNSHLSTGYAPKGKQLIAKNELIRLRLNNQEYEAAKILNGTNYWGKLNCRVLQIHRKRTNYVGFKDYWRKIINESDDYENWCNGTFFFLMLSYIIIAIPLFASLVELYDFWGFLLFIIIAIPIISGGIYIANEVLDL